MKINLKRAILSPFIHDDSKKLLEIYIIALGVTIASFLGLIIALIIFYALMFGAIIILGEKTAGIFIGFLSIVSTFLFLAPFFIPIGYITETLKLEIDGAKNVLPQWSGNFMRFFKNGFRFTVVFFVYYVIYCIVILAPFIIGCVLQPSINCNSIVSMGIFGILVFLLIIIATIVLSLIIPMMWVCFAAENSIMAGLNVVLIFKKIFKNFLEYILIYIILIAISFVAMIICSLLSVTIIGLIAVPVILAFSLPIMTYNMFAQLYRA